MTTQIADAIIGGIRPDGVAVVIQAEHLCMIMRGIKKPGSAIVTSALKGIFRSRPETRAEFFTLLQGR
jgi:GTP cyclohydrolase I